MPDTAYRIETGIPIPTPRRAPKYPWHKLKRAGQSFFVPGKTYHGIYNTAQAAAHRRGWRIVVRRQDGGVRVWRAA